MQQHSRLQVAVGDSPAASDRRCILADNVAPRSHMPSNFLRRALPARLAGLDAGHDFHHGRLAAGAAVVMMCVWMAFAARLEAQQQTPLPPVGSPPLVRNVELNFDAQGGVSSVEYETYLYYMEITNHLSSSRNGRWVPYTEDIEQLLREDFRRLWDLGFLEDLTIEVKDAPYANGVIGKHITFKMEERQRVRMVTFEGSDKLDRADIDTALSDTGLEIRLDSFVDLGNVRQVEALVSAMFSTKGYEFAEISHEITQVAGGPNAVQLAFQMEHGPKVEVNEIDFVGNNNIEDGRLKGQMEHIKERWFLSWLTGRGTYKAGLFEADADSITAYYLANGYIDANVGSPDTEYLEVAEDGQSRGMKLRIPVDEGERYRIGTVRFDGNEVVNDNGMRSLFGGIRPGEFYSQEVVNASITQTREFYGSLGYTGLTMFPDLQRRTSAEYAVAGEVSLGNGAARSEDAAASDVQFAGGTDPTADLYADLQRPTHIEGAPVVDVILRIDEGEQQFVKRITFVGNDNTHDEVIRRELQLVESGVFSTVALQNSIRRLNQLGYFEPLEEAGVDIENVEGSENEVNLTVNLSETNLNQLTFGAGVSQFDGFFGQLSFSTANFLGRGETLSVGLQNGSRLRDINVGYSQPYLFGKNLSGGVNLFSRRIQWIGAYTEDTNGGSVTVGWPLALFTRMFVAYSLEQTGVTDVNQLFTVNPDFLRFNPFFQDALLLGNNGRRTVSKITPSLRFDTVDHPIFPRTGQRYNVSLELAGIGGDTTFWKPILESTWYFPQTRRTTIGFRAQYQHLVAPTPGQIPIFERLWQGGEFSVRGFDIRRIGPAVCDLDAEISCDSFQGRTVLGGNKSLLFNAEYQISIAQPVRIIFFYDTGQVQDFGRDFRMNEFKTSTGAELRFFMPMLNVPFRLIYSWNPQRDGVYNDNFQPQEKTTFRFAVGSTF